MNRNYTTHNSIYVQLFAAILLCFSQLAEARVKLGFFVEGASTTNGKYQEKYERSKLKVKGDSEHSSLIAGFALDTGQENLPFFSYRLNAGLALGYMEKSADKFNGQKAPIKSGLAANCAFIDQTSNPYYNRRNRSNWRKQQDFCVDISKGKDRYTTAGMHTSHDFTFAVYRNQQLRLWLAPSLLLAYTAGVHHSDSDLSFITFDAGYGPTLGLDVLNSKNHVLALKLGAKQIHHIGDMSYYYGSYSDAKIRSKETQAFLNFSILY